MSAHLPTALAVFGRRRTWGELLYAVLGLPLGVAGFTFTVTTLSVSAGLVITFVGLPLLAVTGLASRYFGSWIRSLANRLTGSNVAPPAPFRTEPGVFGFIKASLRDGTAWRARLYLLLKLPLGIATFVSAAVFWVYGLGALSYPIWRPFLPCQTGTDGKCHRGSNFGNSYFIDTPGRIAWFALAGALLLLAAPWVTRAVVNVDRSAMRVLVGASERDARVAELEHSRAVAVDDAATTLRRIERDLHDGTQARLVALAMNVGLAKEKLAEGGDPGQAQALLDTAHATAKQAIAEVRDLARGIHPPVLDSGLDAALATLASHSAIPVDVRTALPHRPDAAIETIAYFCAAELLTNAAKHSGARAISVSVHDVDHKLVLIVHDDGHGGARIGAGSGLAGLAERISAVDGTLRVDSPAGGPTSARVELPMSLSGGAPR
jgi:signal transduction histidine kinase